LQIGHSLLSDQKTMARLRRLIILWVIGFILHPFIFCPLPAEAKAQFSIVYTNDTMGEVEPCG